MHGRIKIEVLFITLGLLLVFCQAAGAFSAYVIWVVDGDTIKVVDEKWSFHTIRIYGIDCPESDQDYGFWARYHTATAVWGRKVEISPVNIDSYGRLVGKVKRKSRSLALELVSNGYAWVYDRYCKLPECNQLHSAEVKARIAEKGLWSKNDPVPPWLWRHSRDHPGGWRFW